MPRKTVINNLIIIWQGQSWTVLAPDGEVLARFPDKYEAMSYAETNWRYVSDYAEDGVDFVVLGHKQKRGHLYGPMTGNWQQSALKFAVFGIVGVVVVLAGREGITMLHSGLASVDWGALLVQAAIAIVAIIAGITAIVTVGTVAAYLATVVAVILGVVGACGLITSVLFGWPWSL